MYRLACTLLAALAASFPLAADPAKRTEIPASLQTAIESSRHAVEANGAGYRGLNPEQNLQLRFEAGSASVRLPDAEVRLQLTGFGRGRRLVVPVAPAVSAKGNRVEYRRGPLTEWYVNDHRGLEQGFTLAERPAGKGALIVALKIDGDLTPSTEGEDKAALVRNGVAVLRYGGLSAWDSRGRTLASKLEVQGREIRIAVEDDDAAYPVMIDPWLQQTRLTAPDLLAGDSFGSSVSLSGDTAIIGATQFARRSGLSAGAVYVYVRSGMEWTEQAKLTPPDGAANDQFGYSVSLSGDTALVGTKAGSAYVYVRSGTAWTEQAKLTASNGTADFGISVALDGDIALVGADGAFTAPGAAYVFARSGTAWTEQARLTDSDSAVGNYFGMSVALSGDTALVGADGFVNGIGGAAYVYVRSGTLWNQQSKLTASGPEPSNEFGSSVAISGGIALIADANKGGAFIFARSGETWTQQAKLTASDSPDTSFSSAALSGKTAVLGALVRQAAYVFLQTGNSWTQQAKLIPVAGIAGDQFGFSVATMGDATLVGARYWGQTANPSTHTGAAYVFGNLRPTANLTSSLSIGSPTNTLTLTGSGYSPGEGVTVAYISPSGTSFSRIPLGTGIADSAGALSMTLRFPLAVHGAGVIRAAGQRSGVFGAADFLVAPFLVLKPNAGAVGSTVLAQGFGFGAGESVDVSWRTPFVALATATADSTGSFYSNAVTFSVPANALTGHNTLAGKGQITLATATVIFTVR